MLSISERQHIHLKKGRDAKKCYGRKLSLLKFFNSVKIHLSPNLKYYETFKVFSIYLIFCLFRKTRKNKTFIHISNTTG